MLLSVQVSFLLLFENKTNKQKVSMNISAQFEIYSTFESIDVFRKELKCCMKVKSDSYCYVEQYIHIDKCLKETLFVWIFFL